jgi:hypothetical protein
MGVLFNMSYPSPPKITRLEFLKIFGASSASLLIPGLLSSDILAQVQSNNSVDLENISVKVLIKPNVIKLRSDGVFGSIIVFPRGYNIADVDISSVRCEGATALKRTLSHDSRTLILLYNISDLRPDLPGGFAIEFVVTGRLNYGSWFKGADTIKVTGASKGVIYHTSTRKRKSCHACKNHATNKIFAARKTADMNRAHPGCNCRIVKEEIDWSNYIAAFGLNSQDSDNIYDKRWGWPPFPAENA